MRRTSHVCTIAAGCFALLMTLSPHAFSQNLKVGIVDSEVIVKQLPETKAADSKLTEITTKYQDSLELIKKQYNEALEKYDKQKTMMTPEAKTKEEDRIKGIGQSYMQFQEEKFGNTGMIARMREELLSPIRAKIEQAIKTVAKDESISLVLDKATPGVLYFEEKFDMTYRVLDRIKRGNDEKEGKKGDKSGK